MYFAPKRCQPHQKPDTHPRTPGTKAKFGPYKVIILCRYFIAFKQLHRKRTISTLNSKVTPNVPGVSDWTPANSCPWFKTEIDVPFRVACTIWSTRGQMGSQLLISSGSPHIFSENPRDKQRYLVFGSICSLTHLVPSSRAGR